MSIYDDEPDEDGGDVDGGVHTILFTDGDGGDWEDQYTYGGVPGKQPPPLDPVW